jgi:hypothetical protein
MVTLLYYPAFRLDIVKDPIEKYTVVFAATALETGSASKKYKVPAVD